MNDEPRHRDGRYEREWTLEDFLIRRPIEEGAAQDAHRQACNNAPSHGGHERISPRSSKIGEADCDNQERLQPLSQRDNKCLEHNQLLPRTTREHSFRSGWRSCLTAVTLGGRLTREACTTPG